MNRVLQGEALNERAEELGVYPVDEPETQPRVMEAERAIRESHLWVSWLSCRPSRRWRARPLPGWRVLRLLGSRRSVRRKR